MKQKPITGLMMTDKQPQVLYFTEHQQPESADDRQVLEQLNQNNDAPIVFSGNPDMKQAPSIWELVKILGQVTISGHVG